MTHHLAEAYSKIVLLQNGGQSEDRLSSKGCCDGSLPRQAVSAANLRDRPFDNAEVRTNGIQTLYQSAVGQGYS
jgi:hypothetical protein